MLTFQFFLRVSNFKQSFNRTLGGKPKWTRHRHHHLRRPLRTLQPHRYTHCIDTHMCIYLHVWMYLKNIDLFVFLWCAEHSHEQNSESELVKHLKGIIKVWKAWFLIGLGSFFCCCCQFDDVCGNVSCACTCKDEVFRLVGVAWKFNMQDFLLCWLIFNGTRYSYPVKLVSECCGNC